MEKTTQHLPPKVHTVPQHKSRLQYFDSALLLGGNREVVIIHNDGKYHLRVTKNDKLILTK